MQALELLLSGKAMSADEALAVGLVDEVVQPANLLSAARRLALAVASGAVARRRTLQLTQRLPTAGDGFVAAAQALTEARRGLGKRGLTGQLHYELLLEAAAAGLAEGPAVGLQRVSRAGRCKGGRDLSCHAARQGCTTALLQEGECFRAAAATRLHRMLLGLFKLHRSLRKARGVAWIFGQVCMPCARCLLVFLPLPAAVLC